MLLMTSLFGEGKEYETLNKEKRFFNMDYKQAEQFVLNWKMDD